MGDLFGVALTVVLLAGNAFFVGAEFALISARRDRLEALVAQGKRNAMTVIKAGENLSMMLAAAQLGITICSILLGRVGEPAVAHLLEKPFELAGLPDQLLHPVAFALALTIVVILHILLGEMIPKNIALAGPERTALLLVPIHLMFLRLARPLIALYNLAANLSLRMLRIEPKDELDATVSSVELAEMIGESRSEGLLDEEEHRRLTQALGTSERTVADVMVPLATTRSVPLRGNGTTLGDIETAVAETGFSR
ncbi:CNNM domain-containing protein, partial [Nocardia farcinica]